MAVKASVTITISKYRDCDSITRYFKLQASTAAAPAIPTTLTQVQVIGQLQSQLIQVEAQIPYIILISMYFQTAHFNIQTMEMVKLLNQVVMKRLKKRIIKLRLLRIQQMQHKKI